MADITVPNIRAAVIRKFNDTDIAQRADGYLNATAMCQANGKLFADYARLDSTKAFLTELSRSMGYPIDEQNQGLIQSRPGAPSTGGGSWVHPLIASNLGQWLSPAFAVQVALWVDDIRAKGYATAPGVQLTAATVDFGNPDHLIQLLTSYALDKKALMAQVEADKPKVHGFDRISNAEGRVNLTAAAKVLQLPPHTFIKWLDTHGWTYKRVTTRLAYQDKINAGLLDMRVDTVQREDGTDKAVYQVFVTPAGLTKLARDLEQPLVKTTLL